MAATGTLPNKILSIARLVASGTLLGAVLAGSLAGWMETGSFDPRIIGAAVGAVGTLAGRLAHVL
jgi:hypothetical protein